VRFALLIQTTSGGRHLDGEGERPAAAGDRDTVCVVGIRGSELGVRPISELLEIAVHRESVSDMVTPQELLSPLWDCARSLRFSEDVRTAKLGSGDESARGDIRRSPEAGNRRCAVLSPPNLWHSRSSLRAGSERIIQAVDNQ
jgi:hypothetical protein